MKRELIFTFFNIISDKESINVENAIICNKKENKPLIQIDSIDKLKEDILIKKKIVTHNSPNKFSEYKFSPKKINKNDKILIPVSEIKNLKENQDWVIEMSIEKNIEKLTLKFDKKKFENNDLIWDEEIKKIKNEIEIKRNNSQIKYLNENFRKIWIIENSKIKPIDSKKNIVFQIFSKNQEIINSNSIDINSQLLQTPNYKDLKSLNDYIKFFKELTELCQKLLIIIKLKNIQKEKINDLFNFLYTFYKIWHEHTNCFISLEILNFCKLFINVCCIMRKLGFEYPNDEIKIPKDVLNNIDSFSASIIKPEPLEFNKRHESKWDDYKKNQIKSTNSRYERNSNYYNLSDKNKKEKKKK